MDTATTTTTRRPRMQQQHRSVSWAANLTQTKTGKQSLGVLRRRKRRNPFFTKRWNRSAGILLFLLSPWCVLLVWKQSIEDDSSRHLMRSVSPSPVRSDTTQAFVERAAMKATPHERNETSFQLIPENSTRKIGARLSQTHSGEDQLQALARLRNMRTMARQLTPPVTSSSLSSPQALLEQRSIPSGGNEVIVPIVIMAYNRLEYLKRTLQSIYDSDMPLDQVPLIVSVDGHIAEVLEYLQTQQTSENKIQVWVHPYSCHDHPDSFPGGSLVPDPGDMYGNPREAQLTCCKHHFTWLLKETFTQLQSYDTFFFMEEDYIVGPSFYDTIQSGLKALSALSHETDFFGVALDPTNGFVREEPVGLPNDVFFARSFRTGPMTLNRRIFRAIQDSALEYCTMDESNWDWTLVELSWLTQLPHVVLFPSRRQVEHIGILHGMHEHSSVKGRDKGDDRMHEFHGQAVYGTTRVHHTERARRHLGGWGHEMDHNHCLQVLLNNAGSVDST